jgi:hypothetical protein
MAWKARVIALRELLPAFERGSFLPHRSPVRRTRMKFMLAAWFEPASVAVPLEGGGRFSPPPGGVA